MITENATRDELLAATGGLVKDMLQLVGGLSHDQLNQVPYEESWTAAQLVRHVTKSVSGIAQAMKAPGKRAERDPGQNIRQLKEVFLDYSTRLKSPDFIIPEPGPYEKTAVLDDLQSAAEHLRENAGEDRLTELVEGLPLGPVTKLELLHFVVYHTTRHLHQLNRIVEAVQRTHKGGAAVQAP